MTMINQALKARVNATAPVEGLGKEVSGCKNILKCSYDATVQSGVAGDVGLLDEDGNAAILPKGAIVTNVFVYVLAAPTVATSLALKLLATADLMAATVIGSLTVGIFWKGKPVEPGAGAANTTAVGPVTAVLGSQPVVTIAGSTETTAKLKIILEYVIIA